MSNSQSIDFHGDGVHDLDASIIDASLRDALLRCVELQKAALGGAAFEPCADALDQVSEGALERVRAAGDVHGIASDRSISNVIAFSAPNIRDAVRDAAIEHAREEVDARVAQLLRGIFRNASGLEVLGSGHLWYPPGSYMGWHTNSRVPGWRVYLNHAEQPGRSFLRYRDPVTGSIVTLEDRQWNLRVFLISAREPLWHAVYSDTNRFSFGYMVRRDALLHRIRRRVRRMLRPAAPGD